MKNFYLAVNYKENGKLYAYAIKYNSSNNLLSVLQQHNGLVTVNVCESKKHARELVESWNASYKANGTYLFD